jgi:hypothetical protein
MIAQQYDQMVKYATALRLGTTEAEQVLRRFTRGGPHPTCAAHLNVRPEEAKACVLVLIGVRADGSNLITKDRRPCESRSPCCGRSGRGLRG